MEHVHYEEDEEDFDGGDFDVEEEDDYDEESEDFFDLDDEEEEEEDENSSIDSLPSRKSVSRKNKDHWYTQLTKKQRRQVKQYAAFERAAKEAGNGDTLRALTNVELQEWLDRDEVFKLVNSPMDLAIAATLMNIHKLEKICIELNPGPPHDNDTTKQWRNAWAVETQKLRTHHYESHNTKKRRRRSTCRRFTPC
jgi:hypothetical protein